MKKRLFKTVVAGLLAAVMIAAPIGNVLAPYSPVEIAYAATSGKCGDKVTWELSNDGTLTISGTGDMYGSSDYGSSGVPWDSQSWDKKIIIKDGVMSIGEDAFMWCRSLASI